MESFNLFEEHFI